MKSRRMMLGLLFVISCTPAGRSGGGSGGTGGSNGGASGNGGVGGNAGTGGSGGMSGGDAGPDRVVAYDGGKSCGQATMPIMYDPQTPDVLIVFDHSASMSAPFPRGDMSGNTRLSVEQKIVGDLVMSYQDRIRFGWEEFPLNTGQTRCPMGSCCAAPVTVPLGFGNYPPINMALHPTGIISRNGTPTADALRYAREYYATVTDGIAKRYVLLSTDGDPNCLLGGSMVMGASACAQAVDEITKLLAMGVKTIVLGVSEEVAASACLEMMGAAGGAPKPGAPPSFYPGKDPDSLKKFLEDIIGGIAKASCEFNLKSPPPDPTKVAVFFDGVQVPWDASHTDGWDYAPGSTTKILIFGSWCSKLEGFLVKQFDVLWGCPPCIGTVSCQPQ